MTESGVGASVAVTRQNGGAAVYGLPRPPPAPRPAVSGAAFPRAGAGGLKAPASTSAADVTVACGIARPARLSHVADAAGASVGASALAVTGPRAAAAAASASATNQPRSLIVSSRTAPLTGC